MYGFNFEEFTDLTSKIESLGADMNKVAERVLDAGSETAKKAFKRSLPRDKGQAQESVEIGKTKKSKRGSKYRLIESKTKKTDSNGNNVPYLFYVEKGHIRAPKHPFIDKAYRNAQSEANEPMAKALIQELENHLK